MTVEDIPYGVRLRLSDRFHGWRDGRAEIPEKRPGPGPFTTPHREALIRQAQEVFVSEHLAYLRAVAEPHRRLAAARARRSRLEESLGWAREAFALEHGFQEAAPLDRRRLGEESLPDAVVYERRLRQGARGMAVARETVDRVHAELETVEAEIGVGLDDARRIHEAATARVVRVHEHVHRRLATYRDSLVHAHPFGVWVNAVMSPTDPKIPGWAQRGGHDPEGPPEEPPVQDPLPEDPLDGPRSVRQIPLTHDLTHFGSAPLPGDEPAADAGYVTLDAPVAAFKHFSLLKTSDGLVLKVRGHGHGPYIEGSTVVRELLTEGSTFDFADRRYKVLSLSLLEDAPLRTFQLVADGLNAKTGKKIRLSDMSFVQDEQSFMAILGPSGAGKSSLFSALLGELPLESGRLFFANMSLDTYPEQIRDLLGFVPQDTLLHQQLTVRTLLGYGYRLRAPAPSATRLGRIRTVCESLDLDKQMDQLVTTLSGGQRRRVSIALEMLTNPKLLMLDEPTSGLDAGLDRKVMRLMRRYVDEDHTVIMITHATEHLGEADKILVVVQDGRPAFAGEPRESQPPLGFRSYADLMTTLLADSRGPAEAYARRSQEVVTARNVADRLEAASPAPSQDRPRNKGLLAFWRQLRVTVRRQWTLVLSRGRTKNPKDRTWLDVLRNIAVVVMPTLIAGGAAALAALVATPPGLGTVPHAGGGPVTLSLLTTLCVLGGQALTYSDIVAEFDIIRREYRAGVRPLVVMLGKWWVFATIAVVQAAVITWVFCLFHDRRPDQGLLLGPQLDLLVSLAALTVTAMTLGILISTLADRLDQAVALVTAFTIAQITFNGVTSDLSGPGWQNWLSLLFPDRWGLAAAASSVEMRVPTGRTDRLWTHELGQWSANLSALAFLTVVFFALATWRLSTRLRPSRDRSFRARLLDVSRARIVGQPPAVEE